VGGWRILDQRAVQRCLDLACDLRREETRTRARIREREHWQAARMPEMAQAMIVTPECAACGSPATRVELVAPGQLPARWEQWPASVRDAVMRDRGPGQWYLILDGVAAGNGYGSPVEAGEAGRIARAFRPPLRLAQVRTAGFYDDAGFCDGCGVPYCAAHWHLSPTGYGTCPLGHGKSLDPHWQPAEDDPAMPAGDNQQQQPPATPVPERDRIDTGYYDDLAGRLYGLLIGMGDRLEGEQAQLLHRFIDVGEYQLALEEIAGTLAHHAIAITQQERSDMLALTRQMKLGDIVTHALEFCPQAT
jgi:hypothetical protein